MPERESTPHRRRLPGLVAAALLAAVVAGFGFGLAGRSRFPRFDERDTKNWQSYGGDWILRGNVYTDRADGRGDKLVGGPRTQGEYAVASDVRFDTAPEDPTFGDAGLLLRVLDPAVGVDAMRAYYGYLRMDDHTLLIGAMSFGFRELASTAFPHELHTGRWYHLEFSAQGCTLRLQAEDTATHEVAEVSYVEQRCDPHAGQVGVRSYYAKASWRNLQVRDLR